MPNPRWTHEELETIQRNLTVAQEAAQVDFPEAKGLPPLSEDECRDFIFAMLTTAAQRPLTGEECFLFGQLLSQYRQSIEARMLGREPGRYYVIPEALLEKFK